MLKKGIVFFPVLALLTLYATGAQSQQIYILPIESAQPARLCSGRLESEIYLTGILVNIVKGTTAYYDSMIISGNPEVFSWYNNYFGNSVQTALVYYAAAYHPVRPGRDTLHVAVYNEGKLAASGELYAEAKLSPPLSLKGTEVYRYGIPSAGISVDNVQLETDTLHDQIQFPLSIRQGPDTIRLRSNNRVIVRSCSPAVIDSIKMAGDFSVFSFRGMPQFPHALGQDDSLVIPYSFRPLNLGKNVADLIFFSGGRTLTWRFSYTVIQLSVRQETRGITIWPNPAHDKLNILSSAALREARLIDILGNRVRAWDNLPTGLNQLKLPTGLQGLYILKVQDTVGKTEEHTIILE